MNRVLLLPAAYAYDQLAGDPEWFPHPVRLIGSAISLGEVRLRRHGQSKRYELLAGAGLTVAVVGGSWLATAMLLRSIRSASGGAADACELLLAWTCLAARNLEQEAEAVTCALQAGNLAHARSRLARIVGRDVAQLDETEVSRAVIETLAESASDGVVAPMFYMALGGVPLAMAYKAVNTLDSMIGHADARYLYFGKFAARLDDVANFIPARLSALVIVAASRLVHGADAQAAWDTWLRDRQKHKSPNAGQPESAIAGALHVALGGENTYAGEVVRAPRLGGQFPAATPHKAVRAIRLVSAATLLGLGCCIFLAAVATKKGRYA